MLIGVSNLFDILFQAKARLDVFLIGQVFLSFFKLVGIIFVLSESYSIEKVLLVFVFSHFFIILYKFYLFISVTPSALSSFFFISTVQHLDLIVLG